MKHFFTITLLILFCHTLKVVPQEVQQGNLYTLISQIKNAMPVINSYEFEVPNTSQQDSFAVLVETILAQNYPGADTLAALQGYKLIEWYDTAYQNRRYYVLMETQANQTGGVEYGWGTYLFYPEGSDRLIIEVPHPLHDINTWRVGFNLFQRLGFKYMLLAGTHRYANGTDPAPADVAHNTSNIFHTVHQKVSSQAQYSYQVHGFSRSDYPDIVLSNGTSSPYTVIDTLATELSLQAFSVGVYDGFNYSAYGATTNTQGQWSRANGYSFIHMELERFIRDSEFEWGKVIDAIEQTFIIIPTKISTPIFKQPDQIQLFSNYPNPFNPGTSFRFILPDRETIRLTVFDITGRLIRDLYNGIIPAGNHHIQWDGRDQHDNLVASGVYIFVLNSSRQRLYQKIYHIK